MTPPPPKRKLKGVGAFALKFIFFAPICLVVWWLVMPYYTWGIGYLASIVLKNMLGVPVESVGVTTEPASILNTDVELTFVVDGNPRRMPQIGRAITNVAPFVALVLSTAGLGMLRRLKVTGIGLVVIAVAHIAFICMAAKAGPGSFTQAIGYFVITLPFLLWITLAYLDKIGQYFAVNAQNVKSVKSTDKEPAQK